MRKIFTLLLLVAGYTVTAQQFNNEWINFDQTYYKFKVGKTGIFRIPKSTLDALGIGGTQVEFFELWRNGEKVPFYPSVASGVLPADGYLEFWGVINDGKPDKALYRDPAYQHTDVPSLISDSSSYFLSVNSNQSGIRYVTVTNDVAGNSRPVEPYFMYTSGNYFKATVNLGFAAVVGEYVYSSSYDKGEFNSTGSITPSTPYTQNLIQMQVNTSGPDATFRFGAVGNALNPRTVKVRINNTDVIDTLMDYFNDVHTTLTVPTSLLTAPTVPVQFNNTSLVGTDRMVVSYFELTYPRNFNFNNLSNFEFTLPAKPQGYYLEISAFNAAGSPPLLYDMATGERFEGDISVAGLVRFALPGTAVDRKLALANSQAGNINMVTSMTTRSFTRFNLTPNQGNYIIISHPSLHTGSNGNDPVMDYKNYRQSPQGGGYTVLVADVEEVIDQFGFGIKKHPVSIRNFLRYARTFFAAPPKFAFMLGKGMTYIDYKKNQHVPEAEKLNLVPTFGYPGSDNMLASNDITDPIAATPIGRLSVISGKEIEDYLEKIKEYELAQRTAPNTIADRAWMKNVVHVTGSSDPYLGTVLCHYMDVYRHIVEDTLFGGRVSNFCKTSTNPIEQISSGRLEGLFAEGISFLTYFGHSSSTTLEFNIDNPQNYNNAGKYPIFFVNGCNAGNFFTYNLQRLIANETLSEKFTLAKQRGSIAFVASTHYGIVNYLNLFLTNLYNTISYTDYGKPIGIIQRDALQKMVNATGPYDFYARSHAEEITLHGDPAISINGQPKPDYVVEESSIKITPTLVSLADGQFTVRARIVNIGMAVSDSLMVTIKHQLPDGSIDTLYRGKIPYVRFADSLTLNVNIDPLRHKGLNHIIVAADPQDAIDEIDETNNMSSREFYIYEDEARPVYPYNLSIIKNPTQKLYASTANPLGGTLSYVMEIDTTEKFNSAIKITKTVSSKGGVIEFDPGITYTDSVVYYWRTAPVPTNGSPVWVNASFTYIPDQEGYNQSHHDQHKQSETDRVIYDTTSRSWKFGRRVNNLFIINGVYPTGATNDNDLTVSVNNNNYIRSACVGNSLVFNVFDSVTFKPWKNVAPDGSNLFLYGSAKANCQPTRNYNFEFKYTSATERKKIMDFMDVLPTGVFVVVRSFDAPDPASFSATWRADTSLYGSNNSLYHKLLAAGFTEIDSINQRRAWILVYKKGDNGFMPRYAYSIDANRRVTLSVDCTTPDTLGYITSPKFGPAKSWKTVQWGGGSIEDPSNDNPSVDVVGVDASGVESTLYILDRYTQDVDISGIDATIYPYVRLRMRNADSLTLSPYQLKYWRVLYDPVPEGALAANLFFTTKDSLEVGENLNFGVAFKNVSSTSFDSIYVKVNVVDRNNLVHDYSTMVRKLRPIGPGALDTVRLSLPTKDLPGDNVLFVDVNADNNQPEQFHFNNFLYRNFYARLDKVNPFLDVTFDGVHILNRDIVSAKPHIQIKLKDEAKYLLLNDTALSLVQVKYPDGNIRTFNFDGDTLRFTPATSGEDNTATLDFNPAFLGVTDNEGDEYELIVRGKDRSNNRAGDVEYRIAFRVISKPMISNLLNYPNPFSTSTAFVFTVTGTDVPQNIKIQILTVTGKIVREITKEELGPIHIGRNITEFKWDGTDQYGQKLGNGVYLYRVVTTMNGKPMEKYRAQGDDTDKYFTNGYGKMYLMR